MSSKLDKFAGPSGRPGPAPEQPAAECELCGKPIAKPGRCAACASRPNDPTLVIAPPRATPNRSQAEGPAAKPTAALRLGWLAVVSSIDLSRKGTVIPLEGPVAVVSRLPTAPDEGQAVVFDDRFISVPHLRLLRVDGGFDLEVVQRSTAQKNAAQVNEEAVSAGARISLGDGDKIDVGTTRLVFRTVLIP